jgi:carboxypeptidase T
MNKLLLTLVSIWSIVVLFGQEQYSRVKIFTDSKGLQSLAELGVGVDHGTLKQGVFFISDFSASEIQTITNNGFSLEVLIEDVKEHYREQNKFSPKEKEKNIDCPDGGGSASSFVPEIPSNFNLGSMGGYYTYQEFLDELDAMAAQ